MGWGEIQNREAVFNFQFMEDIKRQNGLLRSEKIAMDTLINFY